MQSSTTTTTSSSSSSCLPTKTPTLKKLLQLSGYCACHEAVVILDDHYNSSTRYESTEDFIMKLNRALEFAGTSVIGASLAYEAVKRLKAAQSLEVQDSHNRRPEIRINNVVIVKPTATNNQDLNEFDIHYNFLLKKLSSLQVFNSPDKDFQLTKLGDLTSSGQPSIKCICFGLLVKDIHKIDGYLLIDSSGRVPLRLSPDTSFRNKLVYTNCIMLVEGVYTNPDDVLYAANIGLPPVLLDPIQDKSLAGLDDKLVIILRDLYLDDLDIAQALYTLFTRYESMPETPSLFILIGEFTREQHELSRCRFFMKRLVNVIRRCPKLKSSHFVFVPGARGSQRIPQDSDWLQKQVPKPSFDREMISLDRLKEDGFENVHLATNPTHIMIGDRRISLVSHSYLEELEKNLLHDLSDHREEFFDNVKQIILSNGHLSAGVSKIYKSSMNLWHRPDLLVLADTKVTSNRLDYSSSSSIDTSFTTVPSFSKQLYRYKTYRAGSGELADERISQEALHETMAAVNENGDDHHLVNNNEPPIRRPSAELYQID